MTNEMQVWDTVAQLGCFTASELADRLANKRVSTFANGTPAEVIVDRLLDKNIIVKIHDDLYVALDKSTGFPIIDDRFVIASHISPEAYLSHHSAFEYYGCYNQVYYWVYTSGGEAFAPFIYDGLEYHYIPSTIDCGVVALPNGVKVTDMERTALDAVNDFDEIDGLEEVLKCIELLPALDEAKLLKYLAVYDSTYLYQKAGYVMEHYKKTLQLSDSFFEECKCHIGSETNYFSNTDCKHLCNTHNLKWQLLVPTNLYSIAGKGIGTYYDEI